MLKLLDLYCGTGGAAMGYHRAGFTEIVGIDNKPQPHYPFPFVQAEVLSFDSFAGFDLVHASPPCQHFTRYRNVHKDIIDRYEDLIAPTRELLVKSGIPFIIENVPKAPIADDVQLCGSMFGLDVRRHRWFEYGGMEPPAAPPCDHGVWTERKYKSSSTRKNLRYTIEVGAWDEKIALQKECMGVDWPITVRELSEAVPPAYTEWIGRQLLPISEHESRHGHVPEDPTP